MALRTCTGTGGNDYDVHAADSTSWRGGDDFSDLDHYNDDDFEADDIPPPPPPPPATLPLIPTVPLDLDERGGGVGGGDIDSVERDDPFELFEVRVLWGVNKYMEKRLAAAASLQRGLSTNDGSTLSESSDNEGGDYECLEMTRAIAIKNAITEFYHTHEGKQKAFRQRGQPLI
jgi:hypothetical protein